MPLDRRAAGEASPQVSAATLASWIAAGWGVGAPIGSARQCGEIIYLRYCHWRPLTLETLAERYCCGRETVRKREQMALAALRLVPELWRDRLPDGCRLVIALSASPLEVGVA